MSNDKWDPKEKKNEKKEKKEGGADVKNYFRLQEVWKSMRGRRRYSVARRAAVGSAASYTYRAFQAPLGVRGYLDFR